MTFPMTTATLGGAALLAACGVAGMAGGAGGGADAPFACAITAEETGGTLRVAATLQARAAVSGRYALTLRSAGGGMAIDQSGDFAAQAGETVTLGEAGLGGTGPVRGRLVIETADGRVTCPVDPPVAHL